MKPAELGPEEVARYLTLQSEIKELEHRLAARVKEKQELARSFYERFGKNAVYRVGGQDLIVAPTRQGTYYFVARVRWTPEARAAKAEKRRLDRLARLQALELRASPPAESSDEESDEAYPQGRVGSTPPPPPEPGDVQEPDAQPLLQIVELPEPDESDPGER